MQVLLEAGVRDFVLKSDRLYELLMAADALLQGRIFFTSRMTEMVLNVVKRQFRERLLTEREREVVQLVAEGNRTEKIAEYLA
jgi:DNA-binding NarL/FixJ family response regulator